MRGLLPALACAAALSAAPLDKKDVDYGRAGGQTLLLDLHIPDGAGPFAAAILIHGGGFDEGSKSTNVRPLFDPLTDAGFAWFSIDYRLAPKVHFGEAMEDVNTAIRWVKANAARYHLDTSRIAIIGESAGGFFVNYAGTHETPETRVAAVVDFYGPSDYGKLAALRRDHPERFNMASINRHAANGGGIHFFGVDKLDAGGREKLRGFAPIAAVHPGMPPFLVIHGTQDDQVDFEQSTAFCDAIRKVGTGCELIAIEGGGHGMSGWRAPEMQHWKAEMVAWLQKTLAARAEQPIAEPGYGYGFEGPALNLACVAALKKDGEEGFVKAFAQKPEGERRTCLDELAQSLNPEPEVTAHDLDRMIEANAHGKLLEWEDRPLSIRIGHRLGVNIAVAGALARLAGEGLIDDSAIIPPLIQCLEHPFLDVSRKCHSGLMSLTGHTYGWSVWVDRQEGPPTVQERSRAIADWRRYSDRMAHGRPIFDKALSDESRAAMGAVADGLVKALKPYPDVGVVSLYLRGPLVTDPRLLRFPTAMGLAMFDFAVGANNTDNWNTGRVKGVGIGLRRPGIPDPASRSSPYSAPNRQPADYDEVFPALDLEVRFVFETEDAGLRQVAIQAVNHGLEGLRAANAKAAQ